MNVVTYSRFFVSEPIWTNEVSFERAPKVESNQWRKKFVRQSGTEFQPLKIEKEKRGVSSFWVKNSNMHMMAHSKELVELSRMRPESTSLDDSKQSYDQGLIMVRTHFWVFQRPPKADALATGLCLCHDLLVRHPIGLEEGNRFFKF